MGKNTAASSYSEAESSAKSNCSSTEQASTQTNSSKMPPPPSVPSSSSDDNSSGCRLSSEELSRLFAENDSLKKKLSSSQDELHRLKSMLENQEQGRLSSRSSCSETSKQGSRYWTEEEHTRFLEALQAVGPKDVKSIASIVGTRSATQARTHAQKYFLKLARMKKFAEEAVRKGEVNSIQESWLQHVSQAYSQQTLHSRSRKEPGEGTPQSSLNAGKGGKEGAYSPEFTENQRSAKRPKRDLDKPQSTSINQARDTRNKAETASVSSNSLSHREQAKIGAEVVKKHHPHMEKSCQSPSHQEWHDWPRKSVSVQMQGLASSSNEESGATDGSSTHGNGTSHGSYPGSSSNASYSGSNNNSGNDNDSGSLNDNESNNDNDSASNHGSNDGSQTPEEAQPAGAEGGGGTKKKNSDMRTDD